MKSDALLPSTQHSVGGLSPETDKSSSPPYILRKYTFSMLTFPPLILLEQPRHVTCV